MTILSSSSSVFLFHSNVKKEPPDVKKHCSLETSRKLSTSSDVAITKLFEQEKHNMISRAISSSKNHGIALKHGTGNPGLGDCAFEAIIQNNNDRSCFRDKFMMTIDWYRRIWVTDMANRTLNSPFNTLGQQQWLEGWQHMLVPGAYERGIFGDLMLPGIACGVRKILLIFNTNENTPHDPIYVVDPSQFNIRPDTDIPIVLAYNMSHYESMEPCTRADMKATVNLVKEYKEGKYRFGRQDLPFLLTQTKGQDGKSNVDINMNINESRKPGAEDDQTINLEDIDNYLDKEPSKKPGNTTFCAKLNIEEIDNYLDEQAGTETLSSEGIIDLCYKLRNKGKEFKIKEVEGKMQCPSCKIVVKNVQLHFSRKTDCGDKIDIKHFAQQYEKYKIQTRKGTK